MPEKIIPIYNPAEIEPRWQERWEQRRPVSIRISITASPSIMR